MDWHSTFLPVAAAGLSASALLAVFFVFWKFQHAVRRITTQMSVRDAGELNRLSTELATFQEELTALKERSTKQSPTAESAPVRPGMNLGKRTEALRQHRLGQSPGLIAQSLDMPRCELDLLLKIEKLKAATSDQRGSRRGLQNPNLS
jgi:hypothetical protein